MAHKYKTSMELRAAEDRITQLEAEVELLSCRAMARNHQAGDRGQANRFYGGQLPRAFGTALTSARFLRRRMVPPCIMTATRPKNFPLRFASPSSARSTDQRMALGRSVALEAAEHFAAERQ
jgi:hypothetical protein